MPIPLELNFHNKRRLVEALLACDCMKTPQSRNQVLDDLPADIKHIINRWQSDKQDVDGIVRACWQFDDGDEKLLEIVEYYEGDSRAWRNLLVVKNEILSGSAVKPLRPPGQIGQLKKLAQDLADLYEAAGNTKDPLHQARLENKLKEVEECKRENDPRGRLDEVMHEINFTEVQEFLDQSDENSRRDGYAALCLLQESMAMGGEWCLRRIRDRLKKRGGEEPVHVSIVPTELDTLNVYFILNRLAARFPVERPAADLADDLDGYTQAIIQKICASVYIGGRLLIEIRLWEDFTDQDATWSWFLQGFWRPLVRAFRLSEKRKYAKLMVVVVTDVAISSPFLNRNYCRVDSFEPEKVLPLLLRHWTRDELMAWLCEYWGRGRTPTQINNLADAIYNASKGGVPEFIYRAATKRLLGETNL